MATSLQDPSSCDGSLLPTKRLHGLLQCEVLRSVCPLLTHHTRFILSLPVYKKYGSTCLSSVVFWNALPVFWISDADAIKTVQSSRVVFPKDIEAVGLFGPSVRDVNAEIGFFFFFRRCHTV